MYRALFVLLLLLSPLAWADIEFPAPSPRAQLSQKVGLVEVKLDYSRPGVKDRQVFGNLVPYGALWRTGANAPTKITFSGEVKLEGQTVPAGTYSVVTIPGKDEWTFILNKNLELRNTDGYEEKDDVVRLKVKPRGLQRPVESMTFDVNQLRDESAELTLAWEKTLVPVKISVDTNSVVMEQIKKEMFDGAEKSAGTYGNAAFFYYNNGGDLEQALGWMEKAIEKNPSAFYYVHRKALILAKLGRKDEAIATARESMRMVESVPAFRQEYTRRNQDLIDSLQ